VTGLQTLPDKTVLDAEFVVAGGESYHSFERVRRRASVKGPSCLRWPEDERRTSSRLNAHNPHRGSVGK
jgi:hypothetical protein